MRHSRSMVVCFTVSSTNQSILGGWFQSSKIAQTWSSALISWLCSTTFLAQKMRQNVWMSSRVLLSRFLRREKRSMRCKEVIYFYIFNSTKFFDPRYKTIPISLLYKSKFLPFSSILDQIRSDNFQFGYSVHQCFRKINKIYLKYLFLKSWVTYKVNFSGKNWLEGFNCIFIRVLPVPILVLYYKYR